MTSNPIRTIWDVVPNRRRLLGLSVAAAAIRGAAILAVPWILARVVDGAVNRRLPYALIAAVVILQIATAWITLRVRQYVLSATKESILGLRQEMLETIHSWSLAEIVGTDHEALSEFYEAGLTRLDVALRQVLTAGIPALAISIGATAYLGTVSPILLLVAVVSGALLAVVVRHRATLLRSLVQRVIDDALALRSGFAIWLRAALLNRSRGTDVPAKEQQRTRALDFHALTLSTVLEMGRTAEVQSIGTLLVVVTVIVAGGLELGRGTLSPGQLAGAVAAVAMLRAPMQQIMMLWTPVVEGAIGAERVRDVIDRRNPHRGAGTRAVAPPIGLAAHDIHVGYGDRVVLSGAEITLSEGEVVLLRGANGSGKSTLGRVLLGYQAAGAGVVMVNGVPLEASDLRSLRRVAGYLPQSPYILPGTVRDNMTLGHDLTDERLLEAYADAGLSVLIGEPAEGLGLQLAETGRDVSAGQRQGIALAGVLAGRYRLMVLDEPTSHLAGDVAARVLERLRDLEWKPGILLISHRDLPAGYADRIVDLSGSGTTSVRAR